VLDRITEWMERNGEAIYETRPWAIYGEGPDVLKSAEQGASPRPLGNQDIRFTRNKSSTVIYAFVLGWPPGELKIQALGTSSPHTPGRIAKVELIGHPQTIIFRQLPDGLQVALPRESISDTAIALKVYVS
jgi:alpha-L-fucosidase